MARTRMPLVDYQPRSRLQVPQTRVEKARFPAIDIHTHLSWGDVLAGKQAVTHTATVDEILPVMERKNLRLLVNLTGGYGRGLEESLRYWHRAHPDRFLVFTEPWYARIAEPGYPRFQAEEVERARTAGARGVKILMTLGLGLREGVTRGRLVKVDDPRFDPMWEAAGALRMPVAIHTSAPEAFFLPIDRTNERYEELAAHPDWSFHGRDFPAERELEEARNRLVSRHPKTQFLVLHVGLSEDLGYMSECLDRHPNMWVEFGARISELGRQFRTARKFFDRYQDRILFGTDAVPHGEKEYPQQVFCDQLYEIYYRFLETEDEYFDYSTAATPPQGRWMIYGLGLPEAILRKVYHDNAARLLSLA